MWVNTSFSWALNFLPHQVRSAFQLSIRPPSSRMKGKFLCSAQGGTSSGLARFSLVRLKWLRSRQVFFAARRCTPKVRSSGIARNRRYHYGKRTTTCYKHLLVTGSAGNSRIM